MNAIELAAGIVVASLVVGFIRRIIRLLREERGRRR